jgi:hypothetical protein
MVFHCFFLYNSENLQSFLQRMCEVKPFTCGSVNTHIRIYDMVSDCLCNMTFNTKALNFLM